MAVAQSAEPMEEEEAEEEEEEEEERNEAAFHPSAPPSELFDMPTTVDPSYIISLIRKLLPPRVKNDHQLHGEDDCTVQGSETANQDETEASISNIRIHNLQNDESETINTVENTDEGLAHQNGRGDNSFHGTENHATLGGEEAWEEHGCILWDLAANRTHAELMVENLLLEVLLASLTLSLSVRITEISLGILANLSCHVVPRRCIFTTKGLIDAVVDQLFLDDCPCLCEAFRLLTLGLQGSGSISLVETLQQEYILERILWITENTLNPQLLEKSLGLLLVVIENQQEVAQVLQLMEKLGLVVILINLLTCEMDKLSNQRIPERYSVLDMILQVIEALSVIENYSQSISSSKDLLQLVFDLIKLPDKVEVSSCCVTAVVLTANILTDVPDVVVEVSRDLSLLQGLLDIIPFVSDDLEARSALWSVLERVFAQVQDDDTSPSMLCHYISVLVDKSDFIEEDLVDHQLADSDSNKDQKSSSARAKAMDTVTASLSRMHRILNQWTTIKEHAAENNAPRENHPDDEKVSRLLHLCCKYAE